MFHNVQWNIKNIFHNCGRCIDVPRTLCSLPISWNLNSSCVSHLLWYFIFYNCFRKKILIVFAFFFFFFILLLLASFYFVFFVLSSSICQWRDLFRQLLFVIFRIFFLKWWNICYACIDDQIFLFVFVLIAWYSGVSLIWTLFIG